MEESFIKGSFTFVIRGEDLDLGEITENIKIKLSKVRKKGEPITKDKKMKDCYWGSPLI
jgi:hypothetical protein